MIKHLIPMVLVLNGFSEQRSKMMGLLIGLKLALLLSTQIPSQDFETFSPVIKQTIVRFIRSILVTCNWAIHQLDVKNASPWSLAGNHLYEATFEVHRFMIISYLCLSP